MGVFFAFLALTLIMTIATNRREHLVLSENCSEALYVFLLSVLTASILYSSAAGNSITSCL